MTAVAQRPTTRPRDGLLDLLRCVSIVRVIGIHVLNKMRFWFWPAPTYVMPGMPIVFFVSGSLAFQSLRTKADGTRRAAPVYWRSTYRRLLLPYWTYYGVIAAVAVGGDLVSESPKWDLDLSALAVGATGLVVPRPSAAMRHYTGHLWFMAVFLVLALLAPALVRLFEHVQLVPIALALAAFGTAQYLELVADIRVPEEIENLATFSVPYVVGFWYTEGTLKRLSPRVLGAVAVALALIAWAYDGQEHGTVNSSHVKHLVIGLGWLALLLALAPLLRRAAEWAKPVIDRITKRTLTTYLWGWTTCVVAAELATDLTDDRWGQRAILLVVALSLLTAAILTFGRVEDRAAGRTP